MGIRFRCHHCDHELHVKDFQGGRRGKCPVCDGRFRIPLEDAEYSLHAEQKVGIAARSEAPRASQTGQPTESSQSSTGLATSTDSVTAGPVQQAGEDSEVTVSDAQTQASGSATISSEASESNVFLSPKMTAESSAESEAAEANDSSVAEAKQTADDHPEESSSYEEPAEESAEQPTKPFIEPGVPRPTPHAVSQAPRANWYVRPASGGQFGPATSGIFVQWLIEERIAPDSLVWREGWDDWQHAGVALADYFSWKQQRPTDQSAWHPSADSAPAEVSNTGILQPAAQPDEDADAAVSTPSLSERNRSERKRRRRRNYFVLISLLVVMAIILVVALAVVLTQQPA